MKVNQLCEANSEASQRVTGAGHRQTQAVPPGLWDTSEQTKPSLGGSAGEASSWASAGPDLVAVDRALRGVCAPCGVCFRVSVPLPLIHALSLK